MVRLPAATTEFVGRRAELAEGGRLLAAARLLTLTGSAGVGKTRLAIELARRADAGAVWFVELASLRDARAPARALAVAAGLAERREPAELAAGLCGRAGLVVLDNCEHLVEHCAALAAALLAGCEDLRILTTSREALGVPGEVVWQVPALELPDLDARPGMRRLRGCDAVTFFSRCASRRLPGFEVGDPQLAAVARICLRLDANPLALELAAARIAHLTVEEIERRLSDSLQILTSPGRGAADRHRSLGAAIGWSHDLLTDADRTLFRRLSVFRGGFDLDAARVVGDSSDVLAGVARLVDKSLVVSLATSGTPRYRLLETLREYGLAHLRDSGEDAAVRSRHAAWFLGVAERAIGRLHGPDALATMEEFELEHDNFRAAIDWSAAHDASTAARLGSALGELWTRRGYLSEGRERLVRCLEAADAGGESPTALLLAVANLALRQSDVAASRRYIERLSAAARAAGDRSAEAHARDLLGRIELEEGNLEAADREMAAAMGLFREIGDVGGEGRSHWHLSMLAARQGDLDGSSRHLERFQTIVEVFGTPWGIGHAHLGLSRHALTRGDREEAAQHLLVALRLLGAAGDRWSLANAVRTAAALAVLRNAKEHALVLLGAADAMDEAIGARQGPPVRRFIAAWQERALAGTPPDVAGSAAARGRRMALAEAVDFALDAIGPGDAVRAAACLTRREVEVARLMAAGATDREIGARLGISIRTVEKHAENVRSKLGVESRAAVADALAG